MTAQEKINALRKTELFRPVSTDSLKQLAMKAIERKLQQGEVLFTAGDQARGLFVIISGALRAFRQNPEGREQTIHIERAGATLAEVPVFDQGVYPSTVIAEEASLVLFLSKDLVRQFLLENPEAALSALGLMAKRLRHVAALVEQLALHDVAQRLSAMLIEEAVRQAGALKDGVSFSLPLSHQSIAAQLGSVREVITRNLHKLVDEKIIAVRGHRIVVLNTSKLQLKAKLEA
jgi:CRP-like cAMP-binding protein